MIFKNQIYHLVNHYNLKLYNLITKNQWKYRPIY